jgi:ribosomal protein L29
MELNEIKELLEELANLRAKQELVDIEKEVVINEPKR